MAPFDPYHKWLGIPPDQQPVSHYRLLGIEDFESDADVIDAAAEQRTVFLRSFQTGPNSELAERLLNEVSAARVCLLDGKSKARYDQQLRSDLEPTPEDDPLGFTPEELAPVASKPATRPRQRSRSRGGKPFWQEPWAIRTAVGGIVVLLLLLMWLFGSGEEPNESGQGNSPKETSPTSKTPPTTTKTKSLPPSLQEGLVAYYPFNGNANDESGNGHHGEVHGATLVIDRHENTDQAYLFDGVDDYIKCPSIFEKYYPLSLSAWIKVKGPFPDTRFLYSVLSKPHSSRQSGFKLALMKDRVYSTTHPDGASEVRVEAYINGILDEWHCVSLTNNGEHNSLFINGVKVDQRPAQSLKSFSGVLQQNVLIGRELQSYEVNRRSFQGSIDDIRIYNRALSEAEVKALYEFEKP